MCDSPAGSSPSLNMDYDEILSPSRNSPNIFIDDSGASSQSSTSSDDANMGNTSSKSEGEIGHDCCATNTVVDQEDDDISSNLFNSGL